MKLYVGNLSYNTTEAQLREMFQPFGATSASLVMDRDTGRPRGFGFVELPDSAQGQAAIAALNGKAGNAPGLPTRREISPARPYRA